LKRFEFDLSDFSRRKIYDYFEFPPSVNISDYHVDHLSDPFTRQPEDIFDLVGILVHSGTCESGHYYSYIRERPSPTGVVAPTWVEFDDSNVGSFDPSEIAQRAYGGATGDAYNRHLKVFSAYMLFYQRRSTVEKDQRDWVAPAQGRPFKVPAPEELVNAVEIDNSAFLREYCLFDPGHSRFVRQLHAMSRTIHRGTCSEDHNQVRLIQQGNGRMERFIQFRASLYQRRPHLLYPTDAIKENRTLDIVLTHLSQIVWRHPTPDIYMDTLTHLRRFVLSCSTCCTAILQFLAADEYALFNFILRCTHAMIRSQTRTLLIDCLMFLREKEPFIYGIEGTDSDMDLDTTIPAHGMLVAIAEKLYMLAQNSAICTRGWDDFYLTLNQIVGLGLFETAALLDHGILHFCARLLTYKRLQDDVYDFTRIVSGKRRGVFNRLIACLSALLSHMDINLPPVPLPIFTQVQGQNRLALLDRDRMKFPLSSREKSALLRWDEELKAIAVLDKALELFDPPKSEHFYPGDIFKWMLSSRDHSVQVHLFKTIVEGISLDSPYCDAYVRAGLGFCEACPVPDHVFKYIAVVSKAVVSSTRVDAECVPNGDAVLDLFTGLLHAQNETLFEQRHPCIFYQHLINNSLLYATPLLVHTLESVRRGAQAFLRDLIFEHPELPHEVLQDKWSCIRGLIAEMSGRILLESDSSMTRSYMNPLIFTCEALVQALCELSHSEDPELGKYQDENDCTLLQRYRAHVQIRLNAWPDEGTPPSTVETFDQSDYGSESEDAQDFRD